MEPASPRTLGASRSSSAPLSATWALTAKAFRSSASAKRTASAARASSSPFLRIHGGDLVQAKPEDLGLPGALNASVSKSGEFLGDVTMFCEIPAVVVQRSRGREGVQQLSLPAPVWKAVSAQTDRGLSRSHPADWPRRDQDLRAAHQRAGTPWAEVWRRVTSSTRHRDRAPPRSSTASAMASSTPAPLHDCCPGPSSPGRHQPGHPAAGQARRRSSSCPHPSHL